MILIFFVPYTFNPHELYGQLKELYPFGITAINVNDHGTCDVLIEEVQVNFFTYPYPLLCDAVQTEDMAGLSLASVRDIAAMKALAIGSRGAKKDFFDLYQILQLPEYDIDTLIADLFSKYGLTMNFSYVAMGLNYFEDAEQEVLPKTFVPYDWTEIQEFFCEFQQEFFLKIREKLF